jgi:hypothetical protein
MQEAAQNQSVESAVDTNQSVTEQTQTEEAIVVNRSAEELAKRLKEVSLEAKMNRQKNAELKKQLEDAQRTKLQDQGQHKELADIWQRKAQDSEAQTAKLKQAFALKTIADSVSLEAQKLGCIDTDALVNLLPIEQVPIDDTFNVDQVSVKAMLEDFRKSKPYFFQKQAPRIADAAPGKQQLNVGKSLEKMNSQEIEQLLKEKYKK